MFKGNSSVSFRSSKSKGDILRVVEEELEILGNVSISPYGGINIIGSKFSGFGYDTNIEGRVIERDGRYSVNLDYEAKPGTVGWAIAVCFFPIGLTVMILPNNAKSDMQRKADQAISEIKARLDEK